MQKVICPYCGRVAKYVDSSVIYYGHSYGIEEGEPRAEFVQATFEIDPNDPAHLIPTVEVNIRDE